MSNELDLECIRPQWQRHAVALNAFPAPGEVIQIKGVGDTPKAERGKHVFLRAKAGHVNNSNLKEIWNSRDANFFRAKQIFNKRIEIPICAKCENECTTLGYY